jgi:ribonucleoside-diphosphate reductase alpha chain
MSIQRADTVSEKLGTDALSVGAVASAEPAAEAKATGTTNYEECLACQ